jgi:hypothetical protein
MYPVSFTAEFVEQRSRLTTFFRWVMLLPQFFVAIFYAIAVSFAVIGAWFALMFTGRYPEGIYRFMANSVRYFARLGAYGNLMTDVYPPFSGADETGYPVAVGIGPPLEKYSRVKVFFRWIVGIPVMIMLYLYGTVQGIVALCSWVVIVVTGKQPKGLQDLLNLSAAYHARGMAYFLLLTETYPPITEKSQLVEAPARPQLG